MILKVIVILNVNYCSAPGFSLADQMISSANQMISSADQRLQDSFTTAG